MSYYLGIDIGTSSTKTLLMDADGAIIGTAQESYDFSTPAPGYADQNAEVLWQAVIHTIRELTGRYPAQTAALKGIGYSGQMHGLVMLDRDLQVIRDIIIWADIRSGPEIDEIYQMIPREEYNSVTLNPLCTGYLAASLAWVKKHEPQHYERTVKVLFPKDYIRFKMCGNIGVESSDASGSVIFDTAGRDWAWKYIDRLGFRRDIFPARHESYHLAGEVTAECAALTGLKPGIKIAYGGGDTIMQQVGNGMVSGNGVWVSNIGTSCQLSCAADRPVYDRLFRTNTFCHVNEQLWMMMGANVTGGLCLKWLKNQMVYKENFEAMNAIAETVPAGSDGLIFLPYLSGARCPHNDPDAKGMFWGLTLGHTQAHLIRSTMEGIIFSLMDCYQIFQKCGMEPVRMIASGGGARGNLFLQIQADMYNREIYTNLGKEQSCIGAAIAAAVCAGEYASYEQACQRIVKYSDHVTCPNPENHKVYTELFAKYMELYPHNQDLF